MFGILVVILCVTQTYFTEKMRSYSIKFDFATRQGMLTFEIQLIT